MNWTHFKGDCPLTMESVGSLGFCPGRGGGGLQEVWGRWPAEGPARPPPPHPPWVPTRAVGAESRTWLDPGTDAQISSGPGTLCHSAKDK